MHAKEKPPFAAGAQETFVNGTVESLAQTGRADPKLAPGTRFCMCGACGRYFSTPRNFERHRVAFACVDPSTRGMVQDGCGYWRRLPPKHGVFHAGVGKTADFSPKSPDGVDGPNREAA